MHIKKNPNADLESKRPLFFLIGLAVVLLISIFILQWTTAYSTPVISMKKSKADDIVVDIPITVRTVPDIPETKKLIEKKEPGSSVTPEEIIKDLVPDVSDPVDNSSGLPDDEDLLHMITREGIDDAEPETIPVFLVEKLAVPYPCIDAGGGEEQMQCLNEWLGNFIRKNAKPPVIMGDVRLQGKTYVSFIIDEKGNITSIKAERGEYEEIRKEAERVLSLLPQFRPASQMGRPVRMSMTVPVAFK